MLRNRLRIRPLANKKKPDEPLSSMIDTLSEKMLQDEICSISYHTPLIPIKSKDPRNKKNYELGAFLGWISRAKRDPWTNEELTLKTLDTKYTINLDLMAKFDEELKNNSYTRADLLKYYKISYSLYQYLISLKFEHTPDPFAKYKNYIRDEPLLIPIIGLAAFIVFFFIYRTMLISQIALSSSQIDAEIYNSIIDSFETTNIRHYEIYSELCDTNFKLIFFKSNLSNSCYALTKDYFNGISLGMFQSQYFYETTIGRIKENNEYLILAAICCASLSSLYIGLMLAKFSQFHEDINFNRLTKILFNFITFCLVFMGSEAITNALGVFDFLQSEASIRNTCATACNDGNILSRMTDSTVFTPELDRVLNPLVSSTPWLNIVTAGSLLLAGPISFFGARLIQSCRKKTVEYQFNELAKKDYNYLSK